MLIIPRCFHFVWLGGDVPAEFQQYIDTWRQHHENWDIRLWHEPPSVLCNQDLYDRASELAPGSEAQLRADILRYEILEEHGGVYVDCDFECQRSIEPLLDAVGCFAAWEETGVWVNNAIMGAVPDHPFISALIDGLEEQVERHAGPGVRPNVLSGPQYLTGVYKAHKDAVSVFPQHLFYPYSWNELDRKGEAFPEAYAIHHWNNKRSRRGVAHSQAG